MYFSMRSQSKAGSICFWEGWWEEGREEGERSEGLLDGCMAIFLILNGSLVKTVGSFYFIPISFIQIAHRTSMVIYYLVCTCLKMVRINNHKDEEADRLSVACAADL